MGGLTVRESVALTEVEERALAAHVRKNDHAMSPVTAANYFALFAEGYTCEQMLATSNSSFSLGQLVDARLRYKWDERLAKYVDDIHKQALDRLHKFKAEAINHVLDMIAVDTRIKRDEMMRYLQNPTKENMPKDARLSTRELNDLVGVLERVSKLGQPSTPPAQTQPTVGIIAGPGSTVIAGTANTGSDLGAIMRKMSEEQRVQKKAEGGGSGPSQVGG